MATKKTRVFMADFETTVYEGQEYTEVWAAACVELYTEDVQIFHSIGDQLDYFFSLGCNVVAYYHNLKFDGAFWLSYLLTDLGYKQAYDTTGDDVFTARWERERDMPSKSFKYVISDMGQWYSITIKKGKHTIEIRDSLKLLPFSVKRIGESFGTKHKKLEMEYKGFRYAGCEITPEEREYIANDVLVVKEALEIMFNEGHDKLTIGSCCLAEFKKGLLMGTEDYKMRFPNLYEMPIDKEVYGYPTAGDYIHRSYKGGWCYLAKGKAQKVYTNGTTADVNSLYPSVMSGESGNIYPMGKPTFWQGDIPEQALGPNKYFFVRIRCKFYIKPGYLPFIQLKGNLLYSPTEALETSDVYDRRTGRYCDTYLDRDGNPASTRQEMVLTMTDYKLFLEHYDVREFEVVDGCWFFAECGIFDEYIDKYRQIKVTSKGAKRELAKLFLNNLYGKMASSPDSSFKLAVEKDDGSIGFISIIAADKEPGYIPIGSAITSYARDFTIRAAQMNYYGPDKPGFIYADTDSIHCDLPPDQIRGIKVHDTAFCCWKLESCWDKGFFTRQKTYIEHVTMEDLKPVDNPYYNIRCAGMPKKCKDLFELSMSGRQTLEDATCAEEVDFLFDDDGKPIVRTMEDFKVGLRVPGKLMPRRIKGGIVLMDTYYEMR